MAALTETEARTRAGLLDVESYEVFLDLTTEPVRSRSEIRFRCRQPGATTFADLTATIATAVLNGEELGRRPTAGSACFRSARSMCSRSRPRRRSPGPGAG